MDRTIAIVVATRRRMIELHIDGWMTAPAIAEMFGISEKNFFMWKIWFGVV